MSIDLTRRTFLQLVGGVGASFALGSFTTIACASGEADARQKGDPFAPNAFLKIDPDGICTVTISKSDMGQGVRTTFAMLVAEELDADWSKVRVVQAEGDSGKYGGQGTGGSSSTRSMHRKLRDVGATARAMLVAAAAQQWKVDPATCKTDAGKVIGPNGKTLSYGELTTAAKAIPIPSGVKVKDKSEFKIIGKATNRVDNTDVVTGKAMYAMDVKVDGMLYAVCARPPAFRASPAQVDDSAARKVPGVIDVIPIPSGIAVIGKNTWAVLKGREALNIQWDNKDEGVTSASIREELKGAVGDPMDMPSGAKTIEAVFELPYLAHATMEPLNAVADVRDDRAEVWSGTQSPDSAQNMVAQATGLPKEKVTVHTMLLGGGFGRKFSNEWIGEAVELSKRMKKPIKLIWSRECDMQHDLYRPMSHHAMKGAIDAQGNPVGWSHQYLQAGGGGRGGDYGNRTYLPYDMGTAGMKQGGASAPVPTGPWRSVEHTQIIFANECFIDEMAHAAGQDPVEFRKKILKDGRLRKLLDTVVEKGDWGKPLPKGSGRGIALFSGYGSCAAHVVEVTVKGKEIKVDRVVIAVDPGTAINPRGVEAQMQGGCIDGLSTALKAQITIDKGGAVESNWDGYEWMRMPEVPKIEVYLVESGGDFGGMGEVGYPSVAPAVANAVFSATGKRARKLPISVEELV